MRAFEEIKENTQIQRIDYERPDAISGDLLLRGREKPIIFLVTIDWDDRGNRWEHVSVHFYGERRKTPSWADMCAVKEIFWRPDEEVHQIHPKEREYVHGVGALENVLHLWRPVGGWSEED